MINLMVKKLLFLFFICLALFANAQNYRELTTAEKDEIARLNEMAQLYRNDNDFNNAGLTYSRIAFKYWQAGRPQEAIDNFALSAKLYLQKDNYKEVKNIYSNIGVIYTDQEELNFALDFFNKSLDVRKKLGDNNEIAAGLIDVAYILQVLGSTEDAIKKLEEALDLALKQKNSRLISDCYQLLAQNYDQAGNIKKAQEYNDKYDAYQKYLNEESMKATFTDEKNEIEQKVVKSEAEKKLAAEVFDLKQKLFEKTQDSLSTTIKTQNDSLTEANRRAKEKQKENDLLTAQNELNNSKIREQEARDRIQVLIITMAGGGLFLMIILTIVMLRANRARKKANIKLEKQNKEIAEKSEQLGVALKKIAHQNQNITQSINYAQGIQRALLPKPEQLNDYLKESFILFKPRDIVSGDFYWFREIDAQSNIFKIFGMHRRDDTSQKGESSAKKLIISAVDCTGHGVPGAFMSMIGYNLLDEITNKGITRPDLILEELHRGVRFTLKQRETNNQDGMDMAICVIDNQKKTMEYAGAKNPLIYIQNGEVQQIKGDKNGIGGKSDDHKFESHTIDISVPTWAYIFSDGYIDQFGGEQGRKFMIKSFREMLAEIHQKPMTQQKDYLEKTIKDWIGTKYSQIDDLLVIGFKLDLSVN